eukprot:7279947-Prorocentrum_lima.AAC.1
MGLAAPQALLALRTECVVVHVSCRMCKAVVVVVILVVGTDLINGRGSSGRTCCGSGGSSGGGCGSSGNRS